MQDLVLFATLGPIAFMGAIVSGVVLALLLIKGRQRPDMLLPVAIFPMLVVFALTSVTLLSGAGGLGEGDESRHWSVLWSSRATSLILMVIALQRVALRLLDPDEAKHKINFLLPVFVFYWITNVASPMLLGAHRLISHEYVYSLALGSAALLSTGRDGDSMVRAYRDGMLIFLAVGLALLLAHPAWVLSSVKPEFLPGLSGRYSGLATHPNFLGPMTVAFLLCLWNLPYRRSWLTYVAWAIGMLSLLLAESKTTILAFAGIAALVWWIRNGADLIQRTREKRRPHLPAAIISLTLLTVTALVLVVMFSDVGDRISNWMNSRSGEATMTVTGREQIWIVALDEWHRSPLFGYGLSMWDAAYRARVMEVFHAHNQLLQSLAVAGVTGAFGLVLYLLALGAAAIKTARASKGLTLGLFILLLVRSATEIPFTLQGYSIELLMQLMLLTIIASHLAKAEPSRQLTAARARAGSEVAA